MKKNLLHMVLASLFVLCFILSSCKANTPSPKVEETDVITSEETTTASEISETTAAKEVVRGKSVTEKINSVNLANNLLGDDSTRDIYIYLPPLYEESDKRYPVVYFLHGYGDSAKNFISDSKRAFDKAMRNSDNQFIVVALSGENATGGSFYANSPVSGNWEDYIVKEVVAFMDENYRTIPESGARSITGYSMGGFGSVYLGLRHPDVFSSIVAFCPGIYAEGKLNDMWQSWAGANDVKKSYAQVFSPNDDPDKGYGNLPKFDGTPEDNKIIEQWEDGYGNLEKKVDDYIALNTPLNSIEIIYSSNDSYTWIPEGSKELSKILTEKGVNNEIYEENVGHTIPSDFVADYFMPFFEKNMKFE